MNGNSPNGGPGSRYHLVVYALLAGAWYASMAAMFIGLPVLVVASLTAGWHFAVPVWGAAMFILLLLWLPVRDREEAPGRALTRESAPRLFELVESARREAGIGPVAEIRLTPLPTVGVLRVFRGGVLLTRPVKVLILGLPHLRALTVPELASVLVHEFAHFLGQDVHRGEHLAVIEARVGNLRRSIDRTGPLRWGNPVYLWARLYGAVFAVATASMRRRQELLADALAARACSPGVYGRALLKCAATRRLFLRFAARRVLSAAREGGTPRNLFLEVREGIRALHPDDRRRVLREAREAPEPRLSMHPPLADRLERIRRLWVPRRRRPEERGALLVPGLEAIEEEMSPEASRIVLAALVVRARKQGKPDAKALPLPRPAAAPAAATLLPILLLPH